MAAAYWLRLLTETGRKRQRAERQKTFLSSCVGTVSAFGAVNGLGRCREIGEHRLGLVLCFASNCPLVQSNPLALRMSSQRYVREKSHMGQ
jgi:hypothetical protein